MPSLHLRHVDVEFPIYQASGRSLKKILVAGSTRGNLARDAQDRVLVRALRDVSFDIADGERVGIIGANGAGKTTLLKVLAGIFKPTRGRAVISGRTTALINSNVGLSYGATGRENIMLRGMYMDVHPRDMRRRIDEIAEFTELGSYFDMPVHTYSSGMMVRLAFAISTCVSPEILILDEWIAAGDAQFLAKAQRRMDDFVAGSSVLVFASHSLDLVEQWCRQAVYLRDGALQGIGPAGEMIARYRSDIEPAAADTAADTAGAETGAPEPVVTATRVSRLINAPRAAVYRALLDPLAVAKWRVPDGTTSQVHLFESRESGAFRISYTVEVADHDQAVLPIYTFHGRFAALVPDRQVIEVCELETADPSLRGEMTVTITLSDAEGGTEIVAEHEGLPHAMAASDSEIGWKSALAKLAALAEASTHSPT